MKSTPQHGFSIVAAIFILVVLAALAGFIVSMTTTQSMTLAQDVRAARAYQAARAGIEWATSKWLDPASPGCTGHAGIAFADSDLIEFTTVVTATPVNNSAGSGKNFCLITSTASPTGISNPGTAGFVERKLMAIIEGN